MASTTRWMAWALAASLSLLAPAKGLAQEDDAAKAEQAFRDGMAAMKDGRVARACQLLERSIRLDPGMAAEYRLGECYEKLGKLASAWEHFTAVARAARAVNMTDRERVAQRRADALRGRLPALVIEVEEEAGEIPGLEIRRDGARVAREEWGQPVPVNPGIVRIEVSAPRHLPWADEVELEGEGTASSITIPALEPNDDDGAGTNTQAVAGLVTGAIGIVGVAVGIGVGVAAKGEFDDSEANCQGELCNLEGLDQRESAVAMADAATAVFIIGAVATVGGVVLWLTAPPDEPAPEDEPGDGEATIGLSLGPTGVSLTGTW